MKYLIKKILLFHQFLAAQFIRFEILNDTFKIKLAHVFAISKTKKYFNSIFTRVLKRSHYTLVFLGIMTFFIHSLTLHALSETRHPLSETRRLFDSQSYENDRHKRPVVK
jgi:hypothetical protein